MRKSLPRFAVPEFYCRQLQVIGEAFHRIATRSSIGDLLCPGQTLQVKKGLYFSFEIGNFFPLVFQSTASGVDWLSNSSDFENRKLSAGIEYVFCPFVFISIVPLHGLSTAMGSQGKPGPDNCGSDPAQSDNHFRLGAFRRYSGQDFAKPETG
jgi:hypothetical protein